MEAKRRFRNQATTPYHNRLRRLLSGDPDLYKARRIRVNSAKDGAQNGSGQEDHLGAESTDGSVPPTKKRSNDSCSNLSARTTTPSVSGVASTVVVAASAEITSTVRPQQILLPLSIPVSPREPIVQQRPLVVRVEEKQRTEVKGVSACAPILPRQPIQMNAVVTGETQTGDVLLETGFLHKRARKGARCEFFNAD